MYIDRVTLKQIRGFKSLDFSLRRPDRTYAGWTVFTGDNGSGKSTLLKAIAMGLTGKDTARALQPNLQHWVSFEDAGGIGSIQLEIQRTPDDPKFANRGAPPIGTFPALIVLQNGDKQTVLKSGRPDGKSAKYQTPDRTIWSPNAAGWFSCGYGPFRRVFGESSTAAQVMATPSTARYATMFQEAASLAEADRWLRDLKYKELENRQAERQQLAVVLDLMQDELMPNGMTIVRVDSDGLWLADKNGIELAWGEMSDGYRSALALLTDIIRHLIGSYGIEGLVARNDEGRVVVKRSGVVLIDEIDAHLHPEWQREIGFWLTRHFPNIQFLVTTHSPIICQAASPNGLFVLPEPGSEEKPRALGKEEYQKIISSRPDTILLTSAFGLQNTRSPRAVSARAEYARIQAKKKGAGTLSEDDKKRLEAVEPFALNEEEP